VFGIVAASCVACSTVLGVDDLPAKSQDAGVDAPPAPPSFCQKLQPPVTFCRDFDDGAPYDEGVDYWEAPRPNTTIRVDNQNSVSRPASLLSEVAKTSKEERRAYISYKYDQAATNIRLAFDLLIEQATKESENVVVANLSFGTDAPDAHGLSVNVTNTSAHLEESVGNNQYPKYDFAIQPKLGTWSRFEVQILTATRHVTAWIDGQQTVDAALEGTWHPAPLFFSVGTFWVTETDGIGVRLRHDNIVLDLK